MPLLGLLLFALLLTGCGGDVSTSASELSPSSESSSSTPVGPEPGGGAAERQPPADGPLPDTRTGALPMPGAGCFEDPSAADRALRFDGTITTVGVSGATFEVNEVFAGDVPEAFTVDLGPVTKSRASESSPSYFVGTRLLVSALGATAMGCGATRYFDEATATAWRSAS